MDTRMVHQFMREGGKLFSRKDFYEFALYNGFRTYCGDEEPDSGDMFLVDAFPSPFGEQVKIELGQVVNRFGRKHVRVFRRSGLQEFSLKDPLFVGAMLFRKE